VPHHQTTVVNFRISNGRLQILALLFLLSFFACNLYSQEAQPPREATNTVDSAQTALAPPTTLIASDFRYDNGNAIELTWVPSIDDVPEVGRVSKYEIYRSSGGGPYDKIAEILAGGSPYYKDEKVSRDSSYTYYVVALGDGGMAQSVVTAPITPQREWVNFSLAPLFVVALIIGASVVIYISSAKKGKKLFVRKIAGLEAVDEAIGRATEMGRPILFIPGINDMDDVQTLAAITILGRVSRVIAKYDTQIRMPVSRSLVMTTARETIKASYLAAGRPDAYSDDMVNYVTDEQFGYVAAVDGIMVREKPATIFLLGAFFAESLILAETGNSVGAIQIAGTARPAQLPFFIAACDFTLIGEELFAASAYLSGEPKQLGSLKGQDIGKGIAMVFIVVGVIAATLQVAFNWESMHTVLNFLNYIFSSSGQ